MTIIRENFLSTVFQVPAIIITWSMIFLTVFLERNGFQFHVFGVTYLLLSVLHKINLCYGKIENKYALLEQIVIVAGLLHVVVPIIGLFQPIAFWAHLGICFIVHVAHLFQCYLVLNDMNMADSTYRFILWGMNIFEFLANVAFVLRNVFTSYDYTIIALGVEVCALLLSTLKLRKVTAYQHKILPSSANEPSEKMSSASGVNSFPPSTVSALISKKPMNIQDSKPSNNVIDNHSGSENSNPYQYIEDALTSINSRILFLFASEIIIFSLFIPNIVQGAYCTGFVLYMVTYSLKIFKLSNGKIEGFESTDYYLTVACVTISSVMIPLISWLESARIVTTLSMAVINISVIVSFLSFLMYKAYLIDIKFDEFVLGGVTSVMLFISENIIYLYNDRSISKVVVLLVCLTVSSALYASLNRFKTINKTNPGKYQIPGV